MIRFLAKTLAVAGFFAATASFVHAQVGYNGGVYSQNFDTLPGTTNNTLAVAWTDNATLPGWYANKTTFSVTDGTVGGTAATFLPTAAANSDNVGLFSFGSAASTDRALGSRASAAVAGNNPVLYGVRLVNNTAQTLTSFTVTYTGEQWFKSGKTTADTVLVDYQIGAIDLTSGAWTAATGGTFTSLVNTATAATVAGNAAASRRGIAVKVTGVSWAPGTELWVRFRDGDDAGDEQGLAVDDFYFLADNESGIFFNGSTGYVTMGFGATAASLNASSFTLEARFMRTGPGVTASTGTGGVSGVPLIAKGVGEADGSNVDANYFLGIDANGKLVADFEQLNATTSPGGTAYAAGQNFPVTGSTTLQNGVFYHVAATYDTATAIWKLYVNGVPETVTLTIPTFVGVAPRSDNIQGFGLGTTLNSTGARSGFFHGIIDEPRVWNIVRTPSEILANQDQKIAAGTGLLGRYGLDEGTGTTAAGTNAAGAAAPVGTLAGNPAPFWVSSKAFVPNVLPNAALTAPASGSSVVFPAPIALAADASDADGSIVKVEFYNGGTKLGEDLTAPYTYSWTNAGVGNYALTAVAIDNSGSSVTSTSVAVSVMPNPNHPPVVTPSGPADNATGIGSSTTLQLGLADSEGDAQTVTFYGRRATPVAPGPDFAFIAVPDTQYYSENTARAKSTTGNPLIDTGAVAAIFHAQTQWIVDNRDALKIPFVSHMGDIAQNGDAFESEWIVADGALARLENPATTLRAHGIPWGVAPGNHDQQPVADAGGVTNFYTKYFNFTRWNNRPYYGGHFGNKPIVSGGPTFPANTNNYELFSASGLDFIIIHMEYDARAVSNYQAVLDWADALLKAYPDRRAIVTSHWIVNTGNPATFSTQGQAIYDNLKDNPNLFLMLCGHVNGEGRRADTFNGHTVYSILSDYQETGNGGNGFLRILTFKPSTNQIHVESYSPTLNRAVNASDSIPSWTMAYDLPYNMQSAVTDWVPLGTANIAAGGTIASLAWTGLEAGKDYEWYVTSNDGINTAVSPMRRFSTVSAIAPAVALTSPATGGNFNLPGSITLTANASDTDGTVARVEFFANGTKLGESTTAPYSYVWSGMATGSYAITAAATDNSGLDTLSSVANITVSNPNNTLPNVALTAPANSATLTAPITLTATATDSDGTITKIEFFQGTTKLGEDLVAPYTFTWSGAAPGNYALTAVATDNDSGAATSTAVNITVVPAGAFAGSFTEDFNALGTTGTTPPAAWTIWNGTTGSGNGTWTDAIPIIGGASSVANSVGTMLLSSAALTATAAPTATNNNGYNAATPGNTVNRMLATSPTTTNGVALQLELTNTTAAAIPVVRVAYDIQRFTAVATANELPGYWLFYSMDNGANWTNVPALNPTLAGPTGVIVPNTIGVTNVPATNIALSTPWAVGGTLLLRWVDDNAVATSPDQIVGLDNVAVTLPENAAPAVPLTTPTPGSIYLAPAAIDFVATASDSDGSIAKVEFYNGVTKLGESLAAPYTFTLTPSVAGAYLLTAVATDNNGAQTISAPVAITVNPAYGTGVQSFDAMGTTSAAPAGWQVFGNMGGANSTWTNATGIPSSAVGAGTANGTLVAATTFTASSNTQGYNFALAGSPTDRALGSSPTTGSGIALQLTLPNTSGVPITGINVSYDIRRFTAPATANSLPGYQLFYSLDSGATWTNVTALNPTLAGPDGVIVPNTVGVTNVPPTLVTLSGKWNPGANLLLRWIDDNATETSPDQIIGLDNVVVTSATSDPVFGAPPIIAFTTPLNGATFTAPATLTLAVDATDSDGTVSKVEFYNGATKLGEDLTAPFTYDWTAVAVGSYTLTAAATDNSGNRTTSAAITVTATPPPGSIALLRGPYLNSPSDTSMVVRWRSQQAVAGRVRYGLSPDALNQVTDETSAKTDHEVKLTGLTPYTRYYYSVGSAFDTLTPELVDTTSLKPAGFPTPTAADYTFRTSPVPGTATSTRIWVVGDCGRGSAAQAGGRNAYYNFMGTHVPDFVLMLGDNAYNNGTDAEYQTGYFLMYPSIFRKMPQWSTVGNHDANNGDTSTTANWPYYDMFTFPTAGESGGVASGTEHYHSFDYGNIHVINLDSQSSSRNTIEVNGVDGPMAAWLRADLASTTKTWIIVIYHHPEYSKGSHNSDTEAQMVQMRTNFGPILDAGGVDLVLTGHSHAYERSMLVDGHYGISSTITASMKKNAGNGSTTGFTTANGSATAVKQGVAIANGTFVPPDGAYIKPLTGPRDHFGTVHAVNGSAGQADGGTLNHTAMYISYNTVGTLNLDIDGDTLVATYVQSGNTAPDNFTIIKQGAADSDGDGIPDEYEIANGLSRTNVADAALDLDGDRLANGLEYALGTPANSPANGSSLPTIGFATGANAGKLTLTFTRARSDVIYTVQASDNLQSWADIAVNPGAVGESVTVTDVGSGSPTRFLRLQAKVGASLFHTVPEGYLKSGIAGGTPAAPVTTAIGIPLDDAGLPPAGIRAGRIESFTVNSIGNANANWTSDLATPSAPWLVRITSGPSAGRLIDIASNTAGSLTVSGADLTTLGLNAGSDTFELIPADTLWTLFGSDRLIGGATATVADTVQVRSGTAWIAYFYDTNLGFWRRTIGPATNSNNVLIRPNSGVQIVRRGAPTTQTFGGRVLSTPFVVPVNNANSTAVHPGFPIDATLGGLAIQTLVPGWRSAATAADADLVALHNGSAWISYFHNGISWQPVIGAPSNSDGVAIPAGALLTIQRPGFATGTTDLTRLLPYSL